MAAAVPERTVRAVVLPCGAKGTFKGEVYEHTARVQADDGRSTPGFFFWIFRWMVDFLGGTPSHNFAGRSRDAIVGRAAAVLADGLSSSETEQDDEQEKDEQEDSQEAVLPSAEDHVSKSSTMTKHERIHKRKAKSKQVKEEPAEPGVVKEEPDGEGDRPEEDDEEDDDELVRKGDFCLSSFACICWLAQLMAKGPRANSKWNLEPAEVRSRAEALLEGMRDSFWQDVRGRSIEVVQGQLAVDKLATEFGQVAGKIFGKKKVVPVVEALRVLQADSVRRSLSQDRRRLAEKIFSRLVARLAEAIDASKGKTVWMANRVETARGYRKVSHGCQEAVLQAGSAAGPSIAAALQSQKHLTSSVEEKTTRNRDKPGKFLESERLSYCSSGQSTFSSTTVLSVVADAVHVGDDDWLNVFVCDPGCDVSFFCPPQVKKGTCLTAENFVDMWQGRITKFFQKAGTKGRSAGKSTGGVREPERQATQEWLRDVSHSLSAVGWSWSSCGPSADSAKRPNVIVLCTDQEATQLAAVNYLKFGRSLFVEFVNDPAHRSHNDVHLAMASAGLLTFALVSLGLYNVRYGPWNKGTWFGKVQSMADEMSLSMSPSDPLLLTFFPDILADEGRSQEENTEENRRLFLEGLPNRSFVRSKGSKASHSRFNSLSIAHSELDRDWSSFCLVLAALCIAEGWTTSASALWAPGAGKVQEASSGSRSAAKAAARKTMQQQRSSSVNTLHGMTSFACSPDNRSLARTIFFVLQPEGVRCSKMLEELRSFDATVSTYAAWAHWGYVETAREHLVRLSDLAALQRLGLNMAMDHDDDCDEAALVYQDTLARRVVKLTVGLLRFRCGSQLPSTNGWGATAGLLHDSTASRQASLQFLKAVDVTVKAVQETGSLDAKTMLEGHPATGPVMGMVLAELRAASFVEVPPGTFDFLRRCWGGLLNSKLVEDANKVQREAEQRNGTAKTLGRLEGWHGLSRKRLFKDYGRSEVPNGTLVTLPTSFDADAWFVRKKRRTTSGSIATGSASSSQPAVAEETAEEAVCKGVSQARTWASHTPDSEQDKLAGFSLLAKVVRESKDWSFVEKGWWSSLVPEGHGLAFPGSDSVCFVVRRPDVQASGLGVAGHFGQGSFGR
ncbi:Camkk2 [Symbiodinium sp. CCMP2592]|nr:Camkk2 [Symbiodinium sp. CCMP2592]